MILPGLVDTVPVDLLVSTRNCSQSWSQSHCFKMFGAGSVVSSQNRTDSWAGLMQTRCLLHHSLHPQLVSWAQHSNTVPSSGHHWPHHPAFLSFYRQHQPPPATPATAFLSDQLINCQTPVTNLSTTSTLHHNHLKSTTLVHCTYLEALPMQCAGTA